MDTYTLVEPPVRRKMEELLVTWKEPSPTGISPNPIFPLEPTRKIENALLKAKTLALQLEQRRQREMAAAGLVQHRSTPPISFPNQPGWNGNPVHNIFVSNAHSLQNMSNFYPPHPASAPQMGPTSQDVLLGEIRYLLTIVAHKLLLNPGDEEATRQSAALNQLQTILQTSVLPIDQVESVRQQLASLPIQAPPPKPATPPVSEPTQSDRNTGTLLESLRAAGLLGASVSTPPPMSVTPSAQPLSVNANAINLQNSDLELTSASLQKYVSFQVFLANVDLVPISLTFYTILKIFSVVPAPGVSQIQRKVEQNVTHISIGIFGLTRNFVKMLAESRLVHGISRKR